MSLYNIVGSSSLQAGQPEDVSQVLANLQAIQTVLNGGIDDVNIRSTAAITISKLNGYPANANQVLKGDGTWGALPIAALTGYPASTTSFLRGDGTWASASQINSVTWILNGTTSYVAPTGATQLLIEGVAGGGAGGGNAATAASQGAAGGGGSGGNWAFKRLTANIGTHTVAVGAGGTGVSAGSGNNGGDTTFADSAAANVLTAKGGIGGSNSGSLVPPVAGAAAGVATTVGNVGDQTQLGGMGLPGIVLSFTANNVGGGGGVGAVLGGAGANHTLSVGSNGINALANTGGGGAGAADGQSATAKAGGNGGTGLMRVIAII